MGRGPVSMTESGQDSSTGGRRRPIFAPGRLHAAVGVARADSCEEPPVRPAREGSLVPPLQPGAAQFLAQGGAVKAQGGGQMGRLVLVPF